MDGRTQAHLPLQLKYKPTTACSKIKIQTYCQNQQNAIIELGKWLKNTVFTWLLSDQRANYLIKRDRALYLVKYCQLLAINQKRSGLSCLQAVASLLI